MLKKIAALVGMVVGMSCTSMAIGGQIKPIMPPSDDLPQVVVDLAVVYTQTAHNTVFDEFSVDALPDWIAFNVEILNESLHYSNTNTRVRLVGMEKIRFNDSDLPVDGGNETALHNITSPDDGVMDEVHEIRDRLKADIVGLIISNHCCGIAHLAVLADQVHPELAFFVVDIGTHIWHRSFFEPNFGNNIATFVHEIGHVFGLLHDRSSKIVAGQPGVEASITYVPPYAFGYEYCDDKIMSRTRMAGGWRDPLVACDPWINADYDSKEFIDCSEVWPNHSFISDGMVMRYLFSNPDITCEGIPIGVPGDKYTDDPNGPADNARVIREHAPIIANFR